MSAASIAVDSVIPRNPAPPTPANRQVAPFLAVTGATLAVGVTFIGLMGAVLGLHLGDFGPRSWTWGCSSAGPSCTQSVSFD
ncbi:MAG TPA: hypothetical protein VJ400_01125 [Thermoplasmata archaeon]|nr:hypothetical protein [Thermoplasmata archaeon]